MGTLDGIAIQSIRGEVHRKEPCTRSHSASEHVQDMWCMVLPAWVALLVHTQCAGAVTPHRMSWFCDPRPMLVHVCQVVSHVAERWMQDCEAQIRSRRVGHTLPPVMLGQSHLCPMIGLARPGHLTVHAWHLSARVWLVCTCTPSCAHRVGLRLVLGQCTTLGSTAQVAAQAHTHRLPAQQSRLPPRFCAPEALFAALQVLMVGRTLPSCSRMLRQPASPHPTGTHVPTLSAALADGAAPHRPVPGQRRCDPAACE